MNNNKLIILVFGISIVISIAVNLFFGITTEADVWKRTSIEAIYRVGQLEESQKNTTDALNKLTDELKALKNDDINKILTKYGIQ